MAEKARVLFSYTKNSARSQIADAFLRKYGGDRFEAHSARLEPEEIDPLTIPTHRRGGIRPVRPVLQRRPRLPIGS
jgi:arsenate reductase